MVELYKGQRWVCRSRSSHLPLDYTSVLSLCCFPPTSSPSSCLRPPPTSFCLFSSHSLTPCESYIPFIFISSLHSKPAAVGWSCFFFPLLSRFVSSDFSGTEIPFLPLGWLSRAQETWARIIYNLSDPLSPSSSDLSFFKNHVLIQPVFAKYLMFLTQQAAALCFALSPWGQFVWSTRQKHFPLNLLWMWS